MELQAWLVCLKYGGTWTTVYSHFQAWSFLCMCVCAGGKHVCVSFNVCGYVCMCMILYLCNVCMCVPWSAICVSVLEGKVKKIVSNASIKFSAMVIISSALLQIIKNCGCVCVCVCVTHQNGSICQISYFPN